MNAEMILEQLAMAVTGLVLTKSKVADSDYLLRLVQSMEDAGVPQGNENLKYLAELSLLSLFGTEEQLQVFAAITAIKRARE